jgi:CDP-diacylglycerol--glycerol-3-phosphate 3-phosphatidyltransferase
MAVIGLRLAASSSGKIIAADTLGKYKAILLDVAVAMLILNLPYGNLVLWLGVVLAVISGTEYFMKNLELLHG